MTKKTIKVPTYFNGVAKQEKIFAGLLKTSWEKEYSYVQDLMVVPGLDAK